MPLTRPSVADVSLLLSRHSCASWFLHTHLNEIQNANTKSVLPFFLQVAKMDRIHVISEHTRRQFICRDNSTYVGD